MNCSPVIAIALLLLSLTAGAWLLYKTKKENLGTFFKVLAWFVITVSFLSMICCGVRTFCYKYCYGNKECYSPGSCSWNAGGGCCFYGKKHKKFHKRAYSCCEEISSDGCCSGGAYTGCCNARKTPGCKAGNPCCKPKSEDDRIEKKAEADSSVKK